MIYYGLLIVALIFSMVASLKVQTTFNKYNKINVSRRVTSNDVVKQMFYDNDISDVSISRVSGNLSDNYNPSQKTLNLSDSTYGGSTVGAIGVAAHEAGHAIQHKTGYAFLSLRSAMVPAVNIGSKLGIILAVIGMFITSESAASITNLGIALYSLTFLFTVVTLPVEFNASRRAIQNIRGMGWFEDDEIRGMKKVLTAAAMTYVAAMFSSLVSLLRFIAIFSGNRRGRR